MQTYVIGGTRFVENLKHLANVRDIDPHAQVRRMMLILLSGRGGDHASARQLVDR
jgi:hypothetical protein